MDVSENIMSGNLLVSWERGHLGQHSYVITNEMNLALPLKR